MELHVVLHDAIDAGNALLQYADNRILQETYCAKLEIYRHYLVQKRETAELYLKQFREYQDKIFHQAIEILDLAIENANVSLASAALETIRTMKNTYPDFYRSYHHLLLGN